TRLIERLLRSAQPEGLIALIDGTDQFDPSSIVDHAHPMPHFLWMRCRHIKEALKATDWLLRDGNIPKILLDLQGTSPRDLQQVPLAAWHRLRGLTQESGSTFLAFTPCSSIPCAQTRLRLKSCLDLSLLEEPREHLKLPIHVEKSSRQTPVLSLPKAS
ncbi:MAG: hypothetical protein AAF191_13055, partial [Verrucomicrobiota bacterium]